MKLFDADSGKAAYVVDALRQLAEADGQRVRPRPDGRRRSGGEEVPTPLRRHRALGGRSFAAVARDPYDFTHLARFLTLVGRRRGRRSRAEPPLARGPRELPVPGRRARPLPHPRRRRRRDRPARRSSSSSSSGANVAGLRRDGPGGSSSSSSRASSRRGPSSPTPATILLLFRGHRAAAPLVLRAARGAPARRSGRRPEATCSPWTGSTRTVPTATPSCAPASSRRPSSSSRPSAGAGSLPDATARELLRLAPRRPPLRDAEDGDPADGFGDFDRWLRGELVAALREEEARLPREGTCARWRSRGTRTDEGAGAGPHRRTASSPPPSPAGGRRSTFAWRGGALPLRPDLRRRRPPARLRRDPGARAARGSRRRGARSARMPSGAARTGRRRSDCARRVGRAPRAASPRRAPPAGTRTSGSWRPRASARLASRDAPVRSRGRRRSRASRSGSGASTPSGPSGRSKRSPSTSTRRASSTRTDLPFTDALLVKRHSLSWAARRSGHRPSSPFGPSRHRDAGEGRGSCASPAPSPGWRTPLGLLHAEEPRLRREELRRERPRPRRARRPRRPRHARPARRRRAALRRPRLPGGRAVRRGPRRAFPMPAGSRPGARSPATSSRPPGGTASSSRSPSGASRTTLPVGPLPDRPPPRPPGRRLAAARPGRPRSARGLEPARRPPRRGRSASARVAELGPTAFPLGGARPPGRRRPAFVRAALRVPPAAALRRSPLRPQGRRRAGPSSKRAIRPRSSRSSWSRALDGLLRRARGWPSRSTGDPSTDADAASGCRRAATTCSSAALADGRITPVGEVGNVVKTDPGLAVVALVAPFSPSAGRRGAGGGRSRGPDRRPGAERHPASATRRSTVRVTGLVPGDVVELWVDGRPAGTVAAEPWTLVWNAGSAPRPHNLQAVLRRDGREAAVSRVRTRGLGFAANADARVVSLSPIVTDAERAPTSKGLAARTSPSSSTAGARRSRRSTRRTPRSRSSSSSTCRRPWR